jgi:hypothetical protein
VFIPDSSALDLTACGGRLLLRVSGTLQPTKGATFTVSLRCGVDCVMSSV